MNENKKNKTWGPLFCLIILALDVFSLMQELAKPEPDQMIVYLYGFGVVIIIIAFIVAVVKKSKEKKEETK